MNPNPLHLYVKCSRLVFNVEPSEKWDDCEEFETSIRSLYESILCKSCSQLLVDPVIPKKNHFSCQHRVCLDCIGKKRVTISNCKMCSDYTLFEKSNQTKILLRCFQELCELVQSSWIYDYIQRRTNHDTGQNEAPSLLEIIDAGINYGVAIVLLSDTSSDENSNDSDVVIAPLNSQIFPDISPLSPVTLVSPPQEQFTIISDPVIPVPVVSAPQIVQFQPQLVQSPLPSTSKLTPNQPASFIKYPVAPKSIMTPMKVQSTFAPAATPTIYSVMYTGSGNKITLKRKPPDEAVAVASNNMTTMTIKTENGSFKRPPMQISTANVITTTPTSMATANNSNILNDPSKRRGCRCGNATAAPGKLTCCGQRCPCYVDSKACIDCKCKGCRNPHYVDGHKKMRHATPDPKTQQQQQQSFLASIQQQTAIMKDVTPSTSVIKHDQEFNLIEQSTIITKSQSSINNCIISMNEAGQYQIKQSNPRILMKDPVKTMSPLMFPATGIHSPVTTIGGTNSSIQFLGLYSQIPVMSSDKKIIIKNEQTTTAVVSYADTSKLLENTTTYSNNLNTKLL